MSGFDEIVSLFPAASAVPEGLPLVIALTGFSDAGQLVPQLDEVIDEAADVTTIARFTRDLLYDYRARRPVAQFDGSRITEVDMPELELVLAELPGGTRFLLLRGYEPDFRWESVIAVIEEFVAEYSISSVTTFHSIPMPVPHTRPIQSTVSGNRDSVQARWSVWKPQTQVPGSLIHVLEHRLIADTDGEIPFAGFVLLVPHYLADSEFPAVLIAALERLDDATGIRISDDGTLAAMHEAFVAKVAEQVENSDELAGLIGGLEHRYDEFMDVVERDQRHEADLANLPTADEIAAEFESFLAAQAKEKEKENDSDG